MMDPHRWPVDSSSDAAKEQGQASPARRRGSTTSEEEDSSSDEEDEYNPGVMDFGSVAKARRYFVEKKKEAAKSLQQTTAASMLVSVEDPDEVISSGEEEISHFEREKALDMLKFLQLMGSSEPGGRFLDIDDQKTLNRLLYESEGNTTTETSDEEVNELREFMGKSSDPLAGYKKGTVQPGGAGLEDEIECSCEGCKVKSEVKTCPKCQKNFCEAHLKVHFCDIDDDGNPVRMKNRRRNQRKKIQKMIDRGAINAAHEPDVTMDSGATSHCAPRSFA